jgi:hypothetical protein
MTIIKTNMPAPGARVGVVCGPGEFAQDNAGTVICIVEVVKLWDSEYALVMMDSGETRRCSGMNRGPGIGWHYVK